MSDMTLSTTRGRQKDKREQAIRMYARKREGMEGRRKEGIKAKGAQGGAKDRRNVCTGNLHLPREKEEPVPFVYL